MLGIKNVILIGTATRDPELRHISNGKAVSHFRPPINWVIKEQEVTQRPSSGCRARLAETTATYTKEGDSL